jgi:hypothetical protein
VAWLQARGGDQWSVPLPRSAVAATVLAGQPWLVWDGPQPAATMTLTAWTDLDDLWKPDINPEARWQPRVTRPRRVWSSGGRGACRRGPAG